MRALVTNDDGVASAGLTVLAAAACERGMDVTVVAPCYDASGSSASMTAVARDGRVMVEGAADGSDDVGVLGVQGPPAFIVRAAMYGAFGPIPDVVLSGVNRGLNTGRAILHSGTVGAALTAANYGRRGLAISAGVGGDDSWEPDSPVVALALDWLLRSPDATVLNVNVPAGLARMRFRPTSLAEAGTVEGNVTEPGGDFVPVTFADGDLEAGAPGTDSAALAEGCVSVTPIRAVTIDRRFDLGCLMERDRVP